MTTPKKHRISAAERLRTLRLYLELQNTHAVGKVLGIQHGPVANRLKVMGVKLRPHGPSTVSVEECNDPAFLRDLIMRLEAEAAVSPDVSTYPPSDPVTAAEKLETLLLYEQYMSLVRVGEKLGLKPGNVGIRLHRLGVRLPPVGRRDLVLADVNDPDFLARLKRRLRAEVVAEAGIARVGHSRLGPAGKLRILDRYLELESTQQVGRALNVSTASVRARLADMGVRLPGRGQRHLGVYDLNSQTFIQNLRRLLLLDIHTQDEIQRLGEMQ